MRKVKSVSAVIRAIGIVMIVLAVVLMIYATTTNGSDWSTFRDTLTQSGANVKTWDRFSFNHAYYMALRSAQVEAGKATSLRAKTASEYFSDFVSRAEAAEQAALDQLAFEAETYFSTQFDTEAFLASYESQKGNEEATEIREIFEYLDGLSTPSLKSGKALPNLQPASNQEWFEEQHALWISEYGDEVGSFLAYIQTIQRLVQEDGTVTDAQAFTEALSYEEYQLALAVMQSEDNSQAVLLFSDALAILIEENTESLDVVAFLQSEYELFIERFAVSAQPEYAIYLTVVQESLAELGVYDGSYSVLVSRVRDAKNVRDDSSFSAFLDTFSRDLVVSSDNRSAVSINPFIWYLTAKALLIGLIGILLIVFAAVIAKLTTDVIIKKREYKTEDKDSDSLLLVKNLSQYFKSGDYVNKAVNNVSFHIKKGEVFGLVGESGCGKTTTGRTIINLYDPTDGDVYFKGLRISSTKNGAHLLCHQKHKEMIKNIETIKSNAVERKKATPEKSGEIDNELKAEIKNIKQQYQNEVKQIQNHAFESEEEKRKCAMLYQDQRKEELRLEYEKDIQNLRGNALDERKKRYREDLKIASRDNITTKIQMIFQDPIASINPRMTVREIIAEGLIIRGVKDKELIDRKVNEMLDLVGLVPEHASRYPHEFSGGQRQRIGIARAIVLEPELIIADEPISALDVSIQAQIINLLNDLRERMGLTILFIAHNLSVVKYFSDRIAVMYYGNLVEMAPSEELFLHPLHPYTKSLLSAIPYPDPHFEKQRKRVTYEPVLAHDYQTDKPELREIVPGHFIHCNQEEFKRYQQELKSETVKNM